MKKSNKVSKAAQGASLTTEAVVAAPVKKLNKAEIATLETKVSAKSEKKAKADKATTAAVAKKVTEKKDLTYIYPADIINDAGKKKIFRAKMRKQMEKFEKSLKLASKGKSDEKPEVIEKAMAAFKAEHYNSKA